MLPSKNSKASQEAVNGREWRSQVRLVNFSSTGNGEDIVVLVGLFVPCMLGLKFFGFEGTEVISGAHNVGPIRILFAVKLHLLEHVEHLGCMSSTSEHNQDVCWGSTFAAFGNISVL